MTADDVIENTIGRFGKYQTWIFVLITISRIPTDIQLLNVVFLLPKAEFTCLDDGVQNATNHCPCSKPKYDNSTIVTSVVSEWHLICGRRHLASLAQSMLQLGILVGSLFYSFISDRYGRRIAVSLALFLEACFTTISAFVTEYWMFVVVRVLIGTTLGGTMLCCYVLLIELSGKSFRPYIIGLQESSFIISYFILPVVAYYIRDWRNLQLAWSAPWLLVIVYYWLIPESPRWLITAGKTKEAIAILTYIAKKNKQPVDQIEAIFKFGEEMENNNTDITGSFENLFKTPNIRIRTIITAFIWMFCSLTYFGINQYIGRLQGNIYLNLIISAASSIPAILLGVLCTLYLRRKISVVASFSVVGVSLFVFLLVANEYLILTFAILGQTAAYLSFIFIYLFTSELFPTVVRNSALGFASMFARIGGFIAPFVVNIGIEWISISIFSILAFGAAFLCLFLPETRGVTLLNTVEQTENSNKAV